MAKLYQRKWLWIRLPMVLAAAAMATGLWLFAYPMPPARLSITTAGADGAYYLHAQRYAEKFAAHGITLDIRTSAGSQENLERLRQTANPSDLAFMQGGFGYLGTSLEMGNVWTARRDMSFSSALTNGSLFVGLDTLLGPVYFATGFDDQGGSNYYLFLGRTF